MRSKIVVFDYGSGNVRSTQKALERLGAEVNITSDYNQAIDATGLIIPGVGAFTSCMNSFRKLNGPQILANRLVSEKSTLGICVGMQILFSSGNEFNHTNISGCNIFPGEVKRLPAKVLPHMGWNTVNFPKNSILFENIDKDERFYFVHSYAVQSILKEKQFLTTWSNYEGKFLAAIEYKNLYATQFHPEKSGEVGARLLANWLKHL